MLGMMDNFRQFYCKFNRFEKLLAWNSRRHKMATGNYAGGDPPFRGGITPAAGAK